MPQALDMTRFSPPDFFPGEEQDLADREQRVLVQSTKAYHLLFKHCDEWTEPDFLALALAALNQVEMTEDLWRAVATLIQRLDALNGKDST